MENILLSKANNGDADAQFQMYQNLINENKEEAMQWLEKAAIGGKPKAQTVFGIQSIILYKDIDQGCFWIESGLKNGDPDAAFDLYHLYCEGKLSNGQDDIPQCPLNVGRAIQALEYAETLYEKDGRHPAMLFFCLQEAYIKQGDSGDDETKIQKIVHYGEKTMQYDNDPERFLTEEVSCRTERYRQLLEEGNGNEGKEGGCYIATCAYGSYDCPEVWTLRRFRDYTLAETWYGRLFIHAYYAISPTIVKWFGNTSWFRKLWRGKLDKLVKNLNEAGVANTKYEDKEWHG